MHIISMGLTCGVFRTYSVAYLEPSRTQQKCCIADVRLGSNYVSGIGFTVEIVYRISIFI